MEKAKRRVRAHRIVIPLLSAVCVLLVCSLVYAGFTVMNLRRLNNWSRRIAIDNSYFLKNSGYGEGNSESDEDEQKDGAQIIVEKIMSTVNKVYSTDYTEDESGQGEEYSEGFTEKESDGDGEYYGEPMLPEEYLDEIREALVQTYMEFGTDGSYSDDRAALRLYDFLGFTGTDPDFDTKVSKLTNLYKEYGLGFPDSMYYAPPDSPDDPDAMYDAMYSLFRLIIQTRYFESAQSVRLDVPYITQDGILPNGCEAVAATMLLRYAGFDTDPCDFADRYVNSEKLKRKWGALYGPDPKWAYAGDPHSERDGIGCFAPVIVKALSRYMPSSLSAKNTTGMTLEALKSTYIDKGIPVAVWVTVGMDEVSSLVQWTSFNGRETYLYPTNAHCMVFLGYNGDNYVFADPYGNAGIKEYPKDDCNVAFNSLGMQSAVILGGTKNSCAELTPREP